MAITYHHLKRDRALRERGLDFAAAAEVFAAPVFTFLDEGEDYGEERRISIGYLNGRMMVIGWTPRGEDRHVFSMRKANAREQKKYAPLIR